MSEPDDENLTMDFGEPPGNGRTLDEQILELVNWFGPDAVRESVSRHGKKQRGRNYATDLREICHTTEQDAYDWLNGLDPFKIRTNYSIAKAAAIANPGHSYNSTFRRYMRELAKHRVPMVLCIAVGFSQNGYPFNVFFRAEKALAETGSMWVKGMTGLADENREMIARFRQLIGEPDPQMSIAQISKLLREFETKDTAHARELSE